jgi:hypothetical protein
MWARPNMGVHMTGLRSISRNVSRNAFVAVVAVTGLVAAITPAPAATIDDLPGRWSGWGTISLPSGTSEQLKCIATYFINDGGASMVQNLRCASSSYKIDATAKLKLAGGVMTGDWEEKTYAAIGSVKGKTTTDGFNLDIKGDKFTAVLAVTSTNCKQSVTITPTGLDIAKIAISLGKC